jgi:hypothetical protein
MSHRSARGRPVLLGVLSAALLVGATVLPGLSAQAAPAKVYSVSVTPSTAAAGQSTDFFFALTNKTPGNSNPNSFFTTVPFAVTGSITATIVPPPAPPGSTNANASASIEVVGQRINVRMLDPLKTNQVVVLKITATPSSGSCGSSTWAPSGTGVFTGSNLSGTVFNRTGPDPTTTVSCGPGPPASVTFTTEPTNTLVNDCINNLGCPATPSGAVTVEVEDAFGNHVADGTNVTMSIGTDPTGVATLGGTLTQPTSGGFASFPDLTIDTTSSGYDLHAVSGAASGDSAEFAITNTNTSCGGEGEPACTATFPNGTSTVSAPPGTELIIETNQLECSGVQDEIAGTVTINPSGSGVIQVQFTDTIPLPVSGPFPFCKSPPEPPATVPLCSTIPNGFNQDPNGVPCLTEQVEFTGSLTEAILHSVLFMDSTDPHARH